MKANSKLWGATALYLVPLAYGIILLTLVFCFDWAGGSEGILFFLCTVLGVVCCLTCIIGVFGVWCLNEPAIRATVLLVMIENIIVFCFVVVAVAEVCLTAFHTSHLRSFRSNPPRHWRAPPKQLHRLVQEHPMAFAVTAAFMLLCTVISSSCIWILRDFEAYIDAQILSLDRKKAQGAPLLRALQNGAEEDSMSSYSSGTASPTRRGE